MKKLDLKEMFNMFWTRKVYMILIVLIFVIIGGLYSYLYVSPKYKAYTTLLLASSSEDNANTDISLNNNLVSTYRVLIKSKPVLREVINKLRIDETEEDLKNNITVSTEKNTQIIKIEVVNISPYNAKIIANEIAKSFAVQVEKIYNINNVYVIEEAEEPTSPYNINHVKDIGMFAFIGLVVACIYVLIANMLDTKVKTKEDIEKKVGLNVLVSVPVNNFDELPKSTKEEEKLLIERKRQELKEKSKNAISQNKVKNKPEEPKRTKAEISDSSKADKEEKSEISSIDLLKQMSKYVDEEKAKLKKEDNE